MTTLIFVRHGESEGNRLNLFCGQRDYPLSYLGHRQAECTAAYLREHYSIDRIYSSDLIRAVQTAEPVARDTGLTILTDPRLREISVGIWEGTPAGYANAAFPELYRAWALGENVTPERGESREEMTNRLNAALDDILSDAEARCIAVFSHSGIVHQVLHRYVPDPEERQIISGQRCFENASVSVFTFERGSLLNVECFAYAEHLGALRTVTELGVV